MPLLSIVIPTYKRPKQLLRAIASLIDSSTMHEGLEVVVVNDDPQENIDQLISQAFGRRSNLYVVNNKKNLGAPASRNEGYRRSTGDWILFLDDDDWIDKASLKEILKELKIEPRGNLGLLRSRIVRGKSQPIFITPKTENFLWRVRRFGQESNTSSLIFRRSIIDEITGWDENLAAGQDTDLILRAAPLSEPFLIERAIVHVDQNGDDRITTNPRKQMIGKVQFLSKNYSRLHPMRVFRYAVSILIAYPYIRRFFG
jgi:glycosyltransferase involved in cell wall biosynthesis